MHLMNGFMVYQSRPLPATSNDVAVLIDNKDDINAWVTPYDIIAGDGAYESFFEGYKNADVRSSIMNLLFSLLGLEMLRCFDEGKNRQDFEREIQIHFKFCRTYGVWLPAQC